MESWNLEFFPIFSQYFMPGRMEKQGKILVVDDNEDVLFALNALLSQHVEKVKVTTQPERISSYMYEFEPDIILLDMNFQQDVISGNEGFMWLEKILQIDPQAIVILMTAYSDTEKAVRAIKSGATDFIPKPWEKDKLLATIYSALRLRASQREVQNLKSKTSLLTETPGDTIIGDSEPMRKIFHIIEKLSDTEANILLLGENGTGKDLIAHTIHNQSRRGGDVFVSIDLGSIAENLFESELFGYARGAFTDAKKDKPGRMEIASGGTLFLDEIGNLPLPMQAKILTAIEKKEITRVGSTRTIPIDVRFICATNADIYQSVDNGEFRQDLLYRINTIEINVPPLRERGDDIVLLAEHFLAKSKQKYKKNIDSLTPDAKVKLLSYSWPGNVRELQNTIERAVILSIGKYLNAEDLVLSSSDRKRSKESDMLNLEILERNAIDKAVRLSNGNLNKAAELLGISRYALYRKISKNEGTES